MYDVWMCTFVISFIIINERGMHQQNESLFITVCLDWDLKSRVQGLFDRSLMGCVRTSTEHGFLVDCLLLFVATFGSTQLVSKHSNPRWISQLIVFSL